MTTAKKVKTAVIYARYSSVMQNASSIEGQVRLCQKIAAEYDLKVVAIFKDAAKSGQSEAGRDGYAEMLAGVRKRAFDVVVTEDLDRLSRDPADIARFKKILNYNGVEIVDERNGYIDDTNVAVQGLLNTIDKKVRGNKVRRGHDNCVANGKIPGSVAYGYRPVPGRPGEREIDPEQAAIINRIFYEYGILERSPRAIAIDLSREGIPTPRSGREKRYAGSTTWNSQAFVGGMYQKGILGNRKYIGEVEWNTHSRDENPETRKKVKRANPSSHHLKHINPSLRIVEQALWDAAQKVRTARAVKMFGPTGKVSRRPVVARGEHLLSGLLRCGKCNGHMRVAQKSRDGSPRAACAAAHQHATCDHTRSYDMDALANGLRDGLVEHLGSSEAIAAALEAYQEEKKQGGRDDTERKAVERKLNALNVEIARLVDMTMKLSAPPEEFYKKIDAKEAERASLDERLRQLGGAGGSGNVVQFPPTPKFIDVYRRNILEVHAALTKNPHAAETRFAFRDLVDSIKVHPTAKRMPYEFTPYARIEAVQGMNVNPSRRTTKEVIAAQGLSDVATTPSQRSAAWRYSNTGSAVISLGRWRAAA